MIGFAACNSNEIEATVKRVYTSYAEEESFNIRKESYSGPILLSVQGTTSDDYQTRYYSLCMIPDQPYYIGFRDTVTSSSSSHYGWSANSYVEISYQNQIILKGAIPTQYLDNNSDYFAYHECSSNEIEATVTRQYGSDANQEYFRIYPSSYSSNILTAIRGLNSDNYKTQYYSICLEPGKQYQILYQDIGHNGWSTNSYVQITYYGYQIHYYRFYSTSTFFQQKLSLSLFLHVLLMESGLQVKLVKQLCFHVNPMIMKDKRQDNVAIVATLLLGKIL